VFRTGTEKNQIDLRSDDFEFLLRCLKLQKNEKTESTRYGEEIVAIKAENPPQRHRLKVRTGMYRNRRSKQDLAYEMEEVSNLCYPY